MPLVFFLVFFLVLPQMKPVIVTPAVIVAFRIAGRHGLHRNLLGRRRAVAAADCRTSCAADRRAQDRAIPAAHVMSDCRTGRAADGAADYRTAIYGIGIHAGRKKQDDY